MRWWNAYLPFARSLQVDVYHIPKWQHSTMSFEVGIIDAFSQKTLMSENGMSEMDMVERYVIQFAQTKRQGYMNFYTSILREATAKSKDGRIDQSDFLNHSAARSRYSLFTPMEASIIFHFAGRGNGDNRLALVDFVQLLDPRWRAPHEESEGKTATADASFLNRLLQSAYNFSQGGQCQW
jgi:hypothetical protein